MNEKRPALSIFRDGGPRFHSDWAQAPLYRLNTAPCRSLQSIIDALSVRSSRMHLGSSSFERAFSR